MISASMRRAVRRRANYRCEYSHAPEIIGVFMHIDHILPVAKGGQTHLNNLCLAEARCNISKGDRIDAVDPDTGQLAPLFNPRTQVWTQHFQWDAQYTHLIGLSPTGRATIQRLGLNRPAFVAARKYWAQLGLLP